MGRLAEGRPEASDEVGLRDIRDRRHGGHVERLGVGAVHGVAGAQQASVQVLNITRHRTRLPDER